ncbi:GGDEF domain-containing protein [Pseudomonas sp. TCU-HL1]|uniref:GGDEF domain-containing protein n=1 Tax=Pseudomonas sp. TCU-HL1 TaxID=1856685 RepID=UPI00083D94FD|nr:GGDEF domain-containing protein [Pseudomonas sp. TCU-HL1]AOE82628.1 diguanylate cyclase [Pseudomonas sp. TCU-HL1]
MSDDAQRWKAKYLESLEQQETLEKRWDARLDLLRRGLVRSSLAAEGSDKAVDQCMQELREIIRGEQMDAGLSALIPRLERAVLDSEQRRQQRLEQNVNALTGIAGRLLDLDLPRDVRKGLKRFAKQIDERARQPRDMPAMLAELGVLQGQALQALSEADDLVARPGLLQRLFGSGRDDALDDTPAAFTSAEPVKESPAAIEPPAREAERLVPADALPAAAPEPVPAAIETGPLEPAVPSATPAARSRSNILDSLPLAASIITGEGNPEYALPDPPEPGYSAIAPHVADSLRGLLDELDLPAHHQPQAQSLRKRLEGGLNWYELVPVLDDLGVLVLAVTDSDHREFAGYLKQLNQRLALFLEYLSSAQEGYAESLDTVRVLDDQLREHVSGLQASVQDATDLAHLKQSLEQRLDGLLNTMNRYQQQRATREQEVGERLRVLMTRVATMEEEAKGFQDNLEAQRQKALQDPLTGLPNRAAWNERLEIELARQQRYGGDLLLAVIDIDHFKRINDGFGHLAGDKVLKIIAGELGKRLRKTDFIARFGGEEFVLLLPSTPLDGGQQLMENLRSAIEACPFHFKGERVSVTLSAGLTGMVAGEPSDAAFQRADQALYRAKHEGRNRVELAAARASAGRSEPDAHGLPQPG